MNKKTLIILLLAFIVIAIVFSVWIGIFYQKQKDKVEFDKLKQVFSILSSSNIPLISAYGIVTDIKGRNITLDLSGSSITLNINDKSTVFSLERVGSSGNSLSDISRKNASFEDIKKGDHLNIGLKILSSGEIKVKSVIITSSLDI